MNFSNVNFFCWNCDLYVLFYYQTCVYVIEILYYNPEVIYCPLNVLMLESGT